MPALPAIAVAATVAAVAVSAAGAVAAKNASDYNAQMESYNAGIEKAQGKQDALAIENTGQLIQGKAKAAAAASGLDGDGSSTDVEYNDLLTNDQNALSAKYRATIGAYNSSSQQSLDLMAGNNAQTSGAISAGGALLSGAGRTYESYSGSSGTTPGGVFAGSSSEGGPGF